MTEKDGGPVQSAATNDTTGAPKRRAREPRGKWMSTRTGGITLSPRYRHNKKKLPGAFNK